MSDESEKERELKALQAVLAAEHAAVYGYGVVGARVGEDR
ncbi:ferritin-like domain-containing protein, partial [Streptomyces sp. TRM76130]|nr:ferritin-like domain-containing protein [Streptomyces sp. TRM76130]